MDRLAEMERLSDDLADVALVTARLLGGTPIRIGLDDVLKRFGVTRKELENEGE